MTPPTYLLAKFIPDLKRMEPRNVGVVLWTTSGVAARFSFERQDHLGDVDGRTVPNWIAPLAAYKQWVAYWRACISQGRFLLLDANVVVEASSPAFLQAIQSANNGNFLLVEGGTLLDDIPADEVDGACRYLFDTLVDDQQPELPRDLTLNERWDAVLDQAHLKGNPLLRRDYPVASGEETFIFSDALANGVPRRLYERVSYANRQATFMKNAHHAAWQFEKVIQAHIVAGEATAAVLSMNEEQEHEHRGPLASLRSVTQVINLQRPADVSTIVQAIEETVREEQQLHEQSESEIRLTLDK